MVIAFDSYLKLILPEQYTLNDYIRLTQPEKGNLEVISCFEYSKVCNFIKCMFTIYNSMGMYRDKTGCKFIYF